MAQFIGRKGQAMTTQQPFGQLFPEPTPFNGFAPSATTYGDLGQVVVDYVNSAIYMLASQNGGVANWVYINTPTPTFTSLTVNGTSILTGATTIVGATNINASGTASTTIGSATGGALSFVTGTTYGVTATGVATLSAASWGFTGNTLFTGTLGTVGQGITSATFLTATNGDITSSAAAKGVIVNPSTASVASGNPATVNARHGKATFTGPSIAAEADGTFVINNTLITSASQYYMLSMVGATTGAGLCVKSVTLDGGLHTMTILVTNAKGADTTTADISFTFWLLN